MHINMTVRELMRFPVHSVPPDMPLRDLEREFLDKQVSGFPVVENNELVGVVSRSDIVRQLAFERRLAETTSDFYWDQAGFRLAFSFSDGRSDLEAKQPGRSVEARSGSRVDIGRHRRNAVQSLEQGRFYAIVAICVNRACPSIGNVGPFAYSNRTINRRYSDSSISSRRYRYEST